jgi:hypothetical protein
MGRIEVGMCVCPAIIRHGMLCYAVLCCAVLYCAVLHCTAMHYITLHHNTHFNRILSHALCYALTFSLLLEWHASPLSPHRQQKRSRLRTGGDRTHRI